MSNINRERTIQSIKDTPYIKEHPHLGDLFEEWINLMPDAEPTIFDGFYECDRKPGACPSWESKRWTKCRNPYCHRTSRAEHAMTLSEDGWIPCSDHQPKLNKYVLFSTKRWPYPTPDKDNRVFKGMRLKERRSGKIMWFSYGPGYIDDEDVLAWRELPKPYEPKEKAHEYDNA